MFDFPPHAPDLNADIHVEWMVSEWLHSFEDTGPLNQTQPRAPGPSGFSALRVMLLDTVIDPEQEQDL